MKHTPNWLYLDIETVPSKMEPDEISLPGKPTINDVKVGNRKGDVAKAYSEEQLPVLIEKWNADVEKKKQSACDELRKEALDPTKGHVLCIGISFDDEGPTVLYGENEREVIIKLDYSISRLGEKYLNTSIVGHNIKKFDLEFLLLRAIKYKQSRLYRYLKCANVVDTMEEFLFSKYNKRFYSLDDLLRFYELGSKPDDIDGGSVYDFWVSGNTQRIYDYCAEDVKNTRLLHKVLLNMSLSLTM